MNRFGVRIHENQDAGLKLAELERKLIKYLEKKKVQESTRVNGTVSYVLRNGLAVNLYSRNSNEVLEMLVAGPEPTFQKSVDAITRIYRGYIEISYLQRT